MKKLVLLVCIGGIVSFLSGSLLHSQEKKDQQIQIPRENYLIGEEKNLEIIVHVWGEVRNPGEKRVPDGTNILELISIAGGPTEYSNLSKVLLFSNSESQLSINRSSEGDPNPADWIARDREELREKGKAEININKYLKNGKARELPRLLPGDVVEVKRNVWHKWLTFIRVASQIAIIAQIWYWYNRTY